MNRRLVRLLLPVPMVALLASCTASAKDGALSSQEPSLPTTIAGPDQSATDLHTDSAPGAIAAKDQSFGVAAPEHWVNETAKQRKTVLFLKDPKPTAKIFRAFSVIRTSLKKPLPLNDLVEQGMIGQRQQGATVTKVADRRIGGVPAAGYHLTRTTKADKDKVSAKVSQTQYYVVRGTTVYITTLTAAASDRKEATKLQDAILNSWSWGAPSAPTESGSGSPAPEGSSGTPTSPAPGGTPAPSASTD